MKVPSKIKYNDMIEQLDYMVKLYEKMYIGNNEYKVDLSNGKYISFAFMRRTIAHLLGVSVQELKEANLLKSTNTYDLLKELIERSIYIYNECDKGTINYENIFSVFINEKLSSFLNIMRFRFEDIDFACQYDPTKALQVGQPSSYHCDYYIALSNASDYDFLGLQYNDKINRFVSASILTATEYKDGLELLKQIIQGQRIMAVTGLHISPASVNKRLLLGDKAEKFSKLALLSRDNDSFLDVTGEAVYLAKLSRELIESSNANKEFIEMLIQSLQSNNPIVTLHKLEDKSLFDIASQLVQLHNDRLNIPIHIEKQKLLEQLQEMKKQLSDAQCALEKKQEENVGLQAKIEQQDAQLEELQTFKQESFQLYKKHFKTDE